MTLPAGWTEPALGEVVDILDAQRVPVNSKEREKRQGDVPYYGATGQVGWIDKPLFEEELVLLGEDGAPFLDKSKSKAYLISGPSWVNNHAHVLRARSVTSNRYLLHALNAADFGRYVNGTTRLKLTQAAMREIRIPLPPLPEQERIVSAIEQQFSRLDAAGKALQSAKQRVISLKAAAARHAMSGDWPTKTLADVTEHQTYGSSAKATPEPDGGLPMVRMGNIRDGRVDLSEGVKFLQREHPDARRFTLSPGDLLFNRTNSPELVGKSAVYSGEDGAACFASYLIRVRFTEACDPQWAALYLNSPAGRRWAASVRTQQVGQANINGTKLAALPLPLPSVEQQRLRLDEYEQIATVVDALATAIDHGRIRSELLGRGILNEAFSGRLVPQDLGDEPAPDLLARLIAERAERPITRGRQHV